MNSKVQIVNQALVVLGEAPLDIFPNGSKYSTIAATLWDSSLDAVLRSHPWNFAVKREILPELADPPKYDYSAAFNLPTDCLRILDVETDDYRVEGRTILADESSLSIRYIARIVDVTVYDSLFIEALSTYLAWRMAYSITKSEAVRDANWNAYKEIMGLARVVDAQEEPTPEFEESSLITVRY